MADLRMAGLRMADVNCALMFFVVVGFLAALLRPTRTAYDEEPCPFARVRLRLGCGLLEFILQQIY